MGFKPTSGGGIDQLTGEVTAGPGTGSQVATIAPVVTAGSIGGAAAVPEITYNAAGQITGVSSVAPDDTSKVPLSTVTAAGDLIVGTGAGTVSRLGIGANGDVLTVASGALSYAAPAATAMTLISSIVLTAAAASVTFSSIPGTYNHLRIILVARSSYAAATDGTVIRLNGDVGSNYEIGGMKINNTTVAADGNGVGTSFFLDSSVNELPAANATAGVSLASEILFPCYAGTVFNKKITAVGGSSDYALSTTSNEGHLLAGMWRNTAAITSVTFTTYNSADFVVGSAFYLYGIT